MLRVKDAFLWELFGLLKDHDADEYYIQIKERCSRKLDELLK